MKYHKLIVILALINVFLSGCQSCSRSGLRELRSNKESVSSDRRGGDASSNRTVVKMIKNNGVYEIPIEINDVQMNFIIDTGASDISMSVTEATYLYKQGKLNRSDIVGTQNYVVATGEIAEGTVIVLRKVRVGDRILQNVQASVTNSTKSPLLLGQSALAKFGKISIDYTNETITFE